MFSSGDYRFGFNGKENDNGVKGGVGTQQDYGMRIYDPRVGRFLSVDPLTRNYPSWSPYPFAMNRPIDGLDLDGKEWEKSTDPNGNTKISGNVNLELDPDITAGNLLSQEQQEQLKKTISNKFNEILKASNSKFSGEITFNTNNGSNQVVPVLNLISAQFEPGSKIIIAGSTTFETSTLNILNSKNQVRPLEEIAITAVHELLHTLRIGHPFELTQGDDVKLHGIFKDDYGTLDYLKTGIPTQNRALLYNLMNYDQTNIDGITLGNLWKQNPQQSPLLSNDQLSLIMREIDLQKQGFGYNIPVDKNNEKRTKYFYDYWMPFPGKKIRRGENIIRKAFVE